MCLAQAHNAVTPVRLKPVAPQSPVKHSTTEPLCSLMKNDTGEMSMREKAKHKWAEHYERLLSVEFE